MRHVEMGCISAFTQTVFDGRVTLWVCVYDEWIEVQSIGIASIAFIGTVRDRLSLQEAYDAQTKVPQEPIEF